MQLNFNRKEYERKFLQPGGYVGKIVATGIEGETVKVFFDIAQGEFKDIYLKEYQQAGGEKTFDSLNGIRKQSLILISNILVLNMHLRIY